MHVIETHTQIIDYRAIIYGTNQLPQNYLTIHIQELEKLYLQKHILGKGIQNIFQVAPAFTELAMDTDC